MTTETRKRFYERAVTVHTPAGYGTGKTRAEIDAERRAKRERDDEARWGPVRTRKAETARFHTRRTTMNLHTTITLKRGSHDLPSDGSCAMEVAALAAGYDWHEVQSAGDLPPCMSRVIGSYVIGLNDAMPDDARQRLMAYVTRMGGTRGTDAEEQARAEYLVMHAARPAAASAMRSAGFEAEAQQIEQSSTISGLRIAANAEARAANAWAANASRAAAAAWAAAAETFDWQPYLDALDGALRIGPQAPDVETAAVERAVRILQSA